MRRHLSFAATACAWALEKGAAERRSLDVEQAEQPDKFFALAFETVQSFPKQRCVPGGAFG